MNQQRNNSDFYELRKLMRYQFFIICLVITSGIVAYGLHTLQWLEAFKIGFAAFCVAVLGAPLVYSKAKSRIQLFSEIKTGVKK